MATTPAPKTATNPIPPWFQALLDQATQQNVLRPPTTTPTAPTGPATAPTNAPPAGVSGAQMAPSFQIPPAYATHLAAQDRAAELAQGNISDVLLGRHLGIGGAPISESNATGDPRNAFNNPAFFAGNPTNRAAQAIQAQPLWQQDSSGRLIHGTNYPIAPGVVGVPATTGPTSETLPPMTPEEQAATVKRYTPVPDVFAERGLEQPPGGSGQPPPPSGSQQAFTPPIAVAGSTATTPATPYTPPPSALPGRTPPPANVDIDAFLRNQIAQQRQRTNY